MKKQRELYMLAKRIQSDEKYKNVYLDVYAANPMENFVRDAILVLPGGSQNYNSILHTKCRLCRNRHDR